MDETYFNMRDETHFPTFAELPDDYDLDLRYYDDPGSDSDGITEPIKHWCLLVEIIQRVPWGRPVFRVKDKTNEQFTVALYFGSKVELPKIWEKRCKDGGVMAIMYATAHDFKGGQHGIRVEEAENVKFFPCSLDSLLRIGDEVTKVPASNKCGHCEKPGGLQCSRCGFVKYCGKDCQTADWKSCHKNECVAVQQVLDWKKRDWEEFDEYWMD